MNYVSNANQVGRIVAARRRILRLSQHDLARQLNISQNRLSELESNPEKMTLDRLLALLSILGLEMNICDKRSEPASSKLEW